MFYLKHTIVIALYLIFNQTNISAKNTDSMPEIFIGIDSTETSDTTETTNKEPESEPVDIHFHEYEIQFGEYCDIRHDHYFDYENQEVVITTITPHERNPFYENMSQIQPDTVGIDIASEINTEPSQQNVANDCTQDQQHEQLQKEERQEKEQQAYDHLSDFTQEQRRQHIQEVEEQKIKDYNTSYPDKRTTRRTIIKEEDFPKNGRLFAGDPRKFDSDIIIAKVHTLPDLNNICHVPCIDLRFRRLEREYDKPPVKRFMRAPQTHNNQKEIAFLKALQSGEIAALCKRIESSNIEDAQNASDELKNHWGWKRDYSFLIPSIENGTGESGFIARLGINIMQITEKHLITQPDYIKKHTDQQSYLKIQEFKKQCASLQQKNDTGALFNLRQELFRKVIENGRHANLTDTICLALAENAVHDPINHVLSRIKHARTLEEARRVKDNFEEQALEHMRKENIACVPDLKKLLIEQYGFDALKTLQEAYQARPDYVHSPTQSSALHDFPPILNTIQTKSLPIAHKELIHLKSQITDAFAECNITDPAEQKECLIYSFGTDVVTTAQSAYQCRADIRNIITLFNPLDVQSSSLRILETSNTYESAYNGFQILTDQVLDNARLCELECLPHVENHIIDSLHVMRNPKNPAEFVFHTTIVDHLLTDLQCQATAVVTGEPTIWEKTSEVFAHGMTSFILRLNPITQAKDLLSIFGHGIGFLVNRAVEIVTHPIATTQKSIETTTKIIDFLSTISRFTSDATCGLHYLSTQEGQQRLGAFCENIVVLGNAIDKTAENITAKDVAGAVGHITGDVVFTMGTSTVATFLKEINALEKVSNETKIVMQGLKDAALEHPAFVTAEGAMLKMSDGMKNLGDGPIIQTTRELFETAYRPIANQLKKELNRLEKIFEGFDTFNGNPIKLDYDHVFTLEHLIWKNEKASRLGGFHHDFMGTLQNSRVVQIVEKFTSKKDGYYLAEVIIDGISFKNKTFFPKNWSREKVASTIHEAYKNFKNSGAQAILESDGKYKIEVLLEEGVKLRIIMTENGVIRSAYPVFEQILK